jgi:hypothetical protein
MALARRSMLLFLASFLSVSSFTITSLICCTLMGQLTDAHTQASA